MLKNKKNKHLLLLVFLIIFLSLGAKLVFAWEVPLPGLTDNPDVTPSLGTYVVYFFKWGTGIAGVLALISFVVGAVGLINPNVEAHGDAKDRMKGSILGLVLIISSYVIINTINPTMKTLTLNSLPAGPGVYLVGGGEQKECPKEVENTPALPKGYNTIKYDCGGSGGPTLLVWVYPEAYFKGTDGEYGGVNVQRVQCGSSLSAIGRSFKWDLETPGVYFYLGSGCGGFGSSPYAGPVSLQSPFAGNTMSFRIVNDDEAGTDYGAILHSGKFSSDLGHCGFPIVKEGCNNVDLASANSADIWEMEKPSGDGVSFYSEPNGADIGGHAGFFDVLNDQIRTPYDTKYVKQMNFDYTNVDVPYEYEGLCKTFYNCPGSIYSYGSYLVVIYTFGSLPFCQTFTGDVPNMRAIPFVASGETLDSVYIIPTN